MHDRKALSRRSEAHGPPAARQPERGEDVDVARPVDGRRPHDHMVATRRADQLLGGKLRATVGGDRRGRIGLRHRAPVARRPGRGLARAEDEPRRRRRARDRVEDAGGPIDVDALIRRRVDRRGHGREMKDGGGPGDGGRERRGIIDRRGGDLHAVGRQPAKLTRSAHEAADAPAIGVEERGEMAADKPAGAGDERQRAIAVSESACRRRDRSCTVRRRSSRSTGASRRCPRGSTTTPRTSCRA